MFEKSQHLLTSEVVQILQFSENTTASGKKGISETNRARHS